MPSRPTDLPSAKLQKEPFDWTAPDGTPFKLKGIGEGRYAEVFEIVEGPHKGSVIKIYGKQKDTMPYEYAPRRNVEFGPNQIVGDIVYGSELLAQHKILHFQTKQAVFDLDGGLPYLVQQRKGARDFIVSDIKQPLNRAQQQAIVDLYDDMAKAGIIWEDGGAGNIFLRDLGGGKWAAGVVDTDRIAKFGQVPTERLGALMDAPTAGPLYGVNSIAPRRGWQPANAREYMAKALEYKHWVRYENGQFVPGRLDPSVVRSKFPLQADVVD